MRQARKAESKGRPAQAPHSSLQDGWITGVVRPCADNKSKSTATIWKAVFRFSCVALGTTRPFLQSTYFRCWTATTPFVVIAASIVLFWEEVLGGVGPRRSLGRGCGQASRPEPSRKATGDPAIENQQGPGYLPALVLLLRFCRNPA